jgi:2C-methyl-D-erythritol 2,4-cyclodiphosphate synthase
MRIGHGFDVHAFGGDGPIIIGGVRIPWRKACWRTPMATSRYMR